MYGSILFKLFRKPLEAMSPKKQSMDNFHETFNNASSTNIVPALNCSSEHCIDHSNS